MSHRSDADVSNGRIENRPGERHDRKQATAPRGADPVDDLPAGRRDRGGALLAANLVLETAEQCAARVAAQRDSVLAYLHLTCRRSGRGAPVRRERGNRP